MNVIDAFSLDSHQTKHLKQALSKMGAARKVLIIDHQENANLHLASRNMVEVQLIPNLQVTPYHLLNAHHVIFSKAAIQALEEVLAK